MENLEAEASNGDIMNSNHHENDSFDDDNDEDDEYDYFIGSEATSSTRALLDNGSKSSKRKPPSKIENLLSSYVIPDLLMKDNSAFDDHRKNGYDSSTEKDRAMMCGLFKWRPAWLQPLANVYAFSALTGLSYFFSGMAGKALFGQLVSVERQFNIDSTKSGLLNSAWHFGFACSVLFAGHFAKSINIPLAIGLAGIINGFLIMAPSFLELYSPYELPQLDSSTTAFSKNQNSDDRLSDSRFLCSAHSYIESSEFSSFNISINVNETNEALHNDSDGRDSSSNDQRSDFPYYVLLTSMFLQGLICSFRYGALPFVYVDNNVLDKTKTGAYLAISFILSEFTGPLGDLVNSVLSKIPVDLSDTAMSTEDTRFVSAWWLSLLVFGILSAISASFVTLLPRHLVPETTQQQALDDAMVKFAGGECPSRSESVNGPSDAIQMTLITRTKDSKEYCQLATTEDTDIPMSKKSNSLAEPNPSSPVKHLTSALQIVKDFIKSVIRILKNPLYALLAIEISIICVPLAGIGPFFIKYIMFEYNVPMAMTNMAKGLSSAITHIIGTAIGSAISTRIHTRMGYLYLIVITALIGALVTPLIIALGCDNRPIAGLPGPFGGNFSNLHANGSCICDPDLDLLSCGSDGVTYLSPCFAGCTMSNGTVFSNCAQLESGNHSSMLWPGVCKTDCEPNFYLFNAVAAFRTFVFSINNMPRHLLALRILDPEDRATGSAFMHFAPFIVSFPAPIFFGRWIESMCLVWSSDHCSLYDRDNIRYLIGGVELLVSILTVLTYAVMVVLCRRQDRLLLERLMPSQEINIDPDRDEEEGNEEGKYNEEEVLNEELAKEESDDFQRNDR